MNDKTKAIRWPLLIIATLLLFACEDPKPELPTTTKVRVQALGDLLSEYQYRASAQALSLRDSKIAAEIDATVDSILADVGNTVAAGDTLIALDCRETVAVQEQSTATLDAMAARAALAKQQLQRARKLRKSRSISEEELNQKQSTLDAATAEHEAQQASLAIARLDVERCEVKAPFAGVITQRHIQQGERVVPGQSLLQLVDHQNLEVHVQIAAEAADSISTSTKTEFVYNNKSYAVQLISIAAVLDSRTRTQAARFSFIDEKPKAGTLGQIVWSDERRSFPVTMILERNKRSGIFYVENNQAHFHPLANIVPGQPIFIDLPLATQIITDGRLGLAIDEQIEIINDQTQQ